MLKAFEELENAVTKFIERQKKRKDSSAVSTGSQAAVDNEEAAELIRRASATAIDSAVSPARTVRLKASSTSP